MEVLLKIMCVNCNMIQTGDRNLVGFVAFSLSELETVTVENKNRKFDIDCVNRNT